jgi:hypothetical protein
LIHDLKLKNPKKLPFFGLFDSFGRPKIVSGLLRTSNQSCLKNEPFAIAKYLDFDGLAWLGITNRRHQTRLSINWFTVYGEHDIVDQNSSFVGR